METQLTPRRPYLLRAYYDWLLDNQLTPHLVVDATQPNVVVPSGYVQDGQIVLNIAPRAVMAFSMDLQAVSFSARFGGNPFQVYIPMAAVLAIYARENGNGTVFEPEAGFQKPEPATTEDAGHGAAAATETEATKEDSSTRSKPDRSHLKVIK